MRQLNSCCGCFGIRDGALCIGWLYVLISLFVFLGSITNLAEEAHVVRYIQNFENRSGIDVDYPTVQYYFEAGFKAFIATSVITAAVSGFMIYGIVKRNRMLILPWLTWNALEIVFTYGGAFATAAVFIHYSLPGVGVLYFFSFAAAATFMLYFSLIAHQHYDEIRRWPRPNRTPNEDVPYGKF